MRVFVFDDSEISRENFRNNVFPEEEVKFSSVPEVDLDVLENFKPELFVVDLLFGADEYAGIGVIRKIKKSIWKDVPLYICSYAAGAFRKPPGVIAMHSKIGQLSASDFGIVKL